MTLRRPVFPECVPEEERGRYMTALATHDWEEDAAVGRVVDVMIDADGSVDRAWVRRTHRCRRCFVSASETRPNWRGMFSCDDIYETMVATQVLDT